MITLQAHDIGHRFGARILFRKVSTVLEGGSTTAVTGANGSGKSTLLRILAGVLAPAKGNVELRVDDMNVTTAQRPFHCGFVAPYLNVYAGLTCRENLEFLARVQGLEGARERIETVLEEVGLSDRGTDLVQTFSSGMIQRVRVACAMLSQPPVLLLDEPTATLDVLGYGMIRRIIERSKSEGKVVVVATNDAAEAAFCDRTLRIEDYRS